jgi:hypothetical protein
LGLHGNTAPAVFIMAFECEKLVTVYSLVANNLGGGYRLAVHKTAVENRSCALITLASLKHYHN